MKLLAFHYFLLLGKHQDIITNWNNFFLFYIYSYCWLACFVLHFLLCKSLAIAIFLRFSKWYSCVNTYPGFIDKSLKVANSPYTLFGAYVMDKIAVCQYLEQILLTELIQEQE